MFGALANEHRRHILVTLHARGGAMTAGELADRFSPSWSTTTRHLQRRYTLDPAHLRTVTSRFLTVFEA